MVSARLRRFLFPFAVVFILVTPATSQTPTTHLVPQQFSTIQEAIDFAVDGDTIEVGPGPHIGAINFMGKAITVRSASGNPQDTCIDGNFFGSVVTCTNNETPESVLQGFTITNGVAERGGGMLCVGSSPTIKDCIFVDNEVGIGSGQHTGVGGAVACFESSNPRIEDCEFTGNVAVGVVPLNFTGLGGAVFLRESSPVITDCIFRENLATSSPSGSLCVGFGGALCSIDSGSPSIINCIFTKNETHTHGSADFSTASSLYLGGGDPVIIDCVFTADITANAVATNRPESLFIEGCIFEQIHPSPMISTAGSVASLTINVSATGHCAGQAPASEIFVKDCVFEENDRGLAIESANAVVINCRFAHNRATDPCCTGGIRVMANAHVDVINCEFLGNSAPSQGGAIQVRNSNARIINSTFHGNSAGSNCNCSGAILSNGSSVTEFVNSILWDNGPDPIFNFLPAVTTVTSSIVQGGYPGAIDLDPMFVDPLGGDLRLSPVSPVIDAGDNTAVPEDVADLDDDGNVMEATPLDLAGNPRFVDNPNTLDTGIGTPPIVDMGCYENQALEIPFIRGDVDGDTAVAALTDALYLLQFGFVPGSPVPPCTDAADVDDNGAVNSLVDAQYLLLFGFVPGSPMPPPPHPACGPDPTVDSLDCLAGCP